MKPIDYRNETWERIQSRIHGQRLAVYDGFCQHGPITTRELSNRIGISILTVRPRATELYQLGFIHPVDAAAAGISGEKFGSDTVFRGCTDQEAREHFENQKRYALSVVQLKLPGMPF